MDFAKDTFKLNPPESSDLIQRRARVRREWFLGMDDGRGGELMKVHYLLLYRLYKIHGTRSHSTTQVGRGWAGWIARSLLGDMKGEARIEEWGK